MRRSVLFATAAAVANLAAFVNTNSGAALYICATPQPNDLNQAGFEGLTWVRIGAVGNVGETGNKTNMLTYDTWDTDVVQKAKGMTDAGSPTIECARNPTDAGQIILRAAAATNLNYAFKKVGNDNVAVGTQPTIRYNRGLVSGPTEPNGRNEDFDLEVFTLGLQQRQITVDPTSAGNPPVLTVAPAITGTAQVASVLTCSTGTFTGDATIVRTYQWYAGGVLITGATANTYLPVTGDIGKVITCRVIGTNAAGSAQGWAPPTAAVIA